MTEEEKQKVIEAINKRKPELRAWLDRDCWKDYDKDDNTGYHAWYVDEENGIRSIKSSIVIKKPMKEIFDYVINIENKSKYDHKVDHAKSIVHYDDEYDLHYFNYKGMLFIENRDFYVGVYHKFGEDFSEIFTTSFEDPKYPPINKVTRAECIYGGWEFKKQDDGVLCTYYTLGDMKLLLCTFSFFSLFLCVLFCFIPDASGFVLRLLLRILLNGFCPVFSIKNKVTGSLFSTAYSLLAYILSVYISDQRAEDQRDYCQDNTKNYRHHMHTHTLCTSLY